MFTDIEGSTHLLEALGEHHGEVLAEHRRLLREAFSSPRGVEQPFPRRWFALAVLALSLMVIGMDNTILSVARPTLVRDLDAGASELQWIVDSYVLVFAGMLLTMGALGDRFG